MVFVPAAVHVVALSPRSNAQPFNAPHTAAGLVGSQACLQSLYPGMSLVTAGVALESTYCTVRQVGVPVPEQSVELPQKGRHRSCAQENPAAHIPDAQHL
jgi:hypothetical protein